MNQLDRIEAMLRELVMGARKKRVEAKTEEYKECMKNSIGMSIEQQIECERNHLALCAKIWTGNDHP